MQLDLFSVISATVQCERWDVVQGYDASLSARRISQQTVQVKAIYTATRHKRGWIRSSRETTSNTAPECASFIRHIRIQS